MTEDKQRADIQARIDNLGVSVNAVILESKVTSLPGYLKGGQMFPDNIEKVTSALSFMEESQGTSS